MYTFSIPTSSKRKLASPWIEAPSNFGKTYWNKEILCLECQVFIWKWGRSITFDLLLFKESDGFSGQTRKPTKVAHINFTKLSLFRWYFCHFCGFHIVNTLCEEEFIFTSFNTALRHNPSLAKEFFQFRIFHNYWIEDHPSLSQASASQASYLHCCDHDDGSTQWMVGLQPHSPLERQRAI